MRKLTTFSVLALVVSGVSMSRTAFAQIPTADILKHRESELTLGVSGTERNVDRGYSYSLSGAVGLFDRFELGFGNDFLGVTTFDVKFQLFESPPQVPGCGLAFGLSGCNGGYREPFITGRYDLKGFRLHAGYTNSDGEGRAFLGTDFPVLESGSGSISLISGSHPWAWLGLSWEFESLPGISASLTVGFPGVRSDGIQHSLEVSYGFRF